MRSSGRDSLQTPTTIAPRIDALHVRWLGSVAYREALALQQALFEHGREDHVLLLEHPHVFTHGPRADLATNVRVEPASVGADLVVGEARWRRHLPRPGTARRVSDPLRARTRSARPTTSARSSVSSSAACRSSDVRDVGCLDDYPGVWVGVGGPNPRKICAIGVRLARGRTMHGFALNVSPDLRYMRDHIVPCGIGDKPVTSLAEEGITATMEEVVAVVARHAAIEWSHGRRVDRQDVAWRQRPEDLSAFSRGEGPGTAVRIGDRPRLGVGADDRTARGRRRDGRAGDRDTQAGVAPAEGRPRTPRCSS